MPSAERRPIHSLHPSWFFSFFFFNDTATTEIYTLSLHDALPISPRSGWSCVGRRPPLARPGPFPSTRRSPRPRGRAPSGSRRDRKSTRLNSSHLVISYAVFCLKKKKKKQRQTDSTLHSMRRTGTN